MEEHAATETIGTAVIGDIACRQVAGIRDREVALTANARAADASTTPVYQALRARFIARTRAFARRCSAMARRRRNGRRGRVRRRRGGSGRGRVRAPTGRTRIAAARVVTDARAAARRCDTARRVRSRRAFRGTECVGTAARDESRLAARRSRGALLHAAFASGRKRTVARALPSNVRRAANEVAVIRSRRTVAILLHLRTRSGDFHSIARIVATGGEHAEGEQQN